MNKIMKRLMIALITHNPAWITISKKNPTLCKILTLRIFWNLTLHILVNMASTYHISIVEFWGLPPLILFFNTSTGWFGRFVLSTECYRTRKLGYNNLNWPRCSAWVTESLALTDGGFCQKQTLYISDYVKFVSL